MKQNIGEAICQHRQMQKMTQEEFASRLGVTSQAVSKWERGNGLPDVALIEGICNVLNISANTLLGLESNKVSENGNVAAEREIKNNMIAEPLLLEFGEDIIPCVMEGLKSNYVNRKRTELVKCTGMLMPVLRLRDSVELKKTEYRILSYDRVLHEEVLEKVDDETYQKLIDHVADECEAHYAEILNKQLVKAMVDNVKELFPGIADGLIPEKISYLQLERKLQDMLKRGESIRDMIHILEKLEEEN